MRILVALTYYQPHLSGLTNYAQRLAEGLVKRGHAVTVMAARHHQGLPPEETHNGVRILRIPLWAQIGKAALFVDYRQRALAEMRDHDLVLVHYPMSPPEIAGLLRAARLEDRPIVAVYHCDLELRPSIVNRLAQRWVEAAGTRLLQAATRIAVLSLDYAKTSRLLIPHLPKCVVLPPPIHGYSAGPQAAEDWRQRHAPAGDAVIGLAARIASEKGIEYLLAAWEPLVKRLGNVRLLITGEKREALGERTYFQQLQPLFEAWGDRITFLGRLPDREMAAFYGACDVTVLPSVNRTEGFGLAQVESMLCGTPVVASDLPGVRDPIARSGAGRLVPPRDSEALAQAIADSVEAPCSLASAPDRIRKVFRLDALVDDWVHLLSACAPPQEGPPGRASELKVVMRKMVCEVPPFMALVRGLESWLIQRHAPRAPRTLDLGCGEGLFTALTLPTPVAHGLDPHQASLNRARSSGIYQNLIHGSADQIPLEGGSCDLILANSVLEHIEDLEPVLKECRRVVCEGGWLMITAPSHRFAEGLGGAVLLDHLRLPALARGYRDWFNRLSRHFHLDTAEDWQARLNAAGFGVVHHEYYLAPSAMFWFDLMHYLSLPNLVARKCLGRWHFFKRPLFTARWTTLLTGLALRRPDKEGAYVFILARKG